MSESKLLDFPPEAREAPELEVMLGGCATDAERKAVREAFYTFAQGDPGAFGVQFAVLLMAHARALKSAPEAFAKVGQRVSAEVTDAIASHRLSVKEAAAVLSKEAATVADQSALAGQDLAQLREELVKCVGALQNLSLGIVEERKTIQAAAQAILFISERRIIFGLVVAFAAGVGSCGAAVWIWRLACGGF
jgi:hypothetical protein